MQKTETGVSILGERWRPGFLFLTKSKICIKFGLPVSSGTIILELAEIKISPLAPAEISPTGLTGPRGLFLWRQQMAGDWIPMRCDLAVDPAVIQMSAELNLDEDVIVGKLHRLWSWANMQTRDGNAPVTLLFVNRYVDVPNFGEMMVTVGWLEEPEEGKISFPNFERYNGRAGKNRVQTLKRVQEHRERKRNDITVTKPLPEKRREEKRIEPKDMSANADALAVHEHYKLKIHPGARFTKAARAKIQSRLKEYSVEDLKTVIDRFAANNWRMENNSREGMAWFFASEDRIAKFMDIEPEKEDHPRERGNSQGVRVKSTRPWGADPHPLDILEERDADRRHEESGEEVEVRLRDGRDTHSGMVGAEPEPE